MVMSGDLSIFSEVVVFICLALQLFLMRDFQVEEIFHFPFIFFSSHHGLDNPTMEILVMLSYECFKQTQMAYSYSLFN